MAKYIDLPVSQCFFFIPPCHLTALDDLFELVLALSGEIFQAASHRIGFIHLNAINRIGLILLAAVVGEGRVASNITVEVPFDARKLVESKDLAWIHRLNEVITVFSEKLDKILGILRHFR